MKGVSESSLSSRPANEREALVASHSSLSYTEEANKDDLSPSPDANQLDCSDHSILSQFHEDAIRQADFGSYQWDAMVTIGLGLSADSIELFAMPYLLPQIEVDLCSNPAEKGWACAITFLGMIIGSLIWGSLGDQMGRKCILISALSVNFLFNTIAAFMPTYKSFITARFCSAIGVAGIYPIAMIYFSEFLPRSSRAKYVTWHLISWLLGGCYVLLLARIFLPKTGMDMIIESRQHVGGWRQFLLLCAAVPSIPAIIKLVFLSDSPRYLLESGRDVEAMIVYQEIFQKNSKKGQYQLSELELPGPTQSSNRSQSEISNARSYWNSLLQLFIPPHLKVTLLLTIFWFSAGFSYYGFTIWFPEKMQLSLLDEINKNAINTTFALYNGTNFYENLQNRHWNNSIFYNCNFANILLTDVTFDNCTFEKVVFTNISSIGAFFIKSSFANSRFIDTDISRENFVDCYIFNNSIQSNRKFCKNGFNTNIDMNVVFQENGARLIGSFVVMIMTGFYIGQISRTRIIGIALLLSSAGCLAMWILEGAQIIPFLIYNPIIMCALLVALCCANIAVIESYPTHLRSSGFCLMMFAFRSAGFLGVTVYHQFLSLSNSVAIFTTITVLMTAAVSVLKLPNSQTSLL